MTNAEYEAQRWEQVADELDAMSIAPTGEQLDVANRLGVPGIENLPSPVVAAVLRDRLQLVLRERATRSADLPEALSDIEDELGIRDRASLVVGTRAEVSAWFEARYMVKTSQGLRALRPGLGDVVRDQAGVVGERVVSSIGQDGRIYLKGRPTASAWPNFLEMVSRVGAKDHPDAVRRADAAVRNGANYTRASFGNFLPLEPFAVGDYGASDEAIRELEELLQSGERLERPFQELLERHPGLLAPLVVGNWRTFVIPQPRLGAEHVPDFLVLGFNSLGPQWVTVEIEAPRHRIHRRDGGLTSGTLHAVSQIQDWREWLTENVGYAHSQHHLHALTNRAPGLVIIGRDSPSSIRNAARSQLAEQARIEIHSWDWLLRVVRKRNADPLNPDPFAISNVGVYGAREVRPSDEAAIRGDGPEEFPEEDWVF